MTDPDPDPDPDTEPVVEAGTEPVVEAVEVVVPAPIGDPLDAITVATEADVVPVDIDVPMGEAVQLPGVLAARLADPADLRSAIEAVLFVIESPVPIASLAASLEQTTDAVQAAVDDLRAHYDDRGAGMELRDIAGGVRLFTRPVHADVVEHFLRDGQRSRLSQAALETLAVIAYRQPVTRARVSAIRGVNVDGVVRTLLARGLVVEVGTDPDTGGGLFRTTDMFLEKMGLHTLDELPSLAPLLPDLAALDDIDGIEGIGSPAPVEPAMLTAGTADHDR